MRKEADNLVILVVENEPLMRKHLTSRINPCGGITVVETDDLIKAYDITNQLKPLIILYDLELQCSSLADHIVEARGKCPAYYPFYIALSTFRDDVKFALAHESGTNYIINKNFSYLEFRSILSNVLHHKELHNNLLEQQTHYWNLFELSSNPILVVNGSSLQIVEANNMALHVYGYSSGELLKTSLDALAHDPLLVKKIIQQRIVYKGNVTHRKKDGSLFPVEIAFSYFSKEGQDHVLACVTDMTLAKNRISEEKAFSLMHNAKNGACDYKYMSAILLGEENERRRITNEIHDHSGQLLVAAKLSTELLLQKLAGQPFYSDVLELRDNLATTIKSLRELTVSLNNNCLPGNNLEDSIEKLAKQMKSKIDVECFVEPLEPVLTGFEQSQIYRIAEEAMNNAVKHSTSGSAEVVLKQIRNHTLTMRIFSHGINRRKNPVNRGLGLHTMQERGEIIGGKVNIEASEKGFSVELKLPLNNRSCLC